MATIIHETVDASFNGLRISWEGRWAGVLTVLGTLLFLSTLGRALGISAADSGNTDAGTLGLAGAMAGRKRGARRFVGDPATTATIR
jgi:hypothetical protein